MLEVAVNMIWKSMINKFHEAVIGSWTDMELFMCESEAGAPYYQIRSWMLECSAQASW